jgi:hypothetical protein
MEIIELVIMKSHLDSFKNAFKVHIGGELIIGEEKLNGEAVCVSFENKTINVSFLCQYVYSVGCNVGMDIMKKVVESTFPTSVPGKVVE